MLPLRLSEIARLLDGDWTGGSDPLLGGVASLAEAGPNDLSFVRDAKHLAEAQASAAGALIVGRDVEVDKPAVAVDDPYRAFAEVLAGVQTDRDRVFPPGIHPTAVVDASATLAADVAVGPFCVVGAGASVGRGSRLAAHVTVLCDVVIGEDCLVYPQAVIREGCRLGRGVIIHAGAVLGSDGFGYRATPDGLAKVPQVGVVTVADGVEIGAGSTIDRATTGATGIGAGTKIDNLVQVGHNVQIGAHCALSAQSGIAGSCALEDGVVFGGQVGVGDHIRVGAGSQVGGQSGIVGDLPAGSRVFGTPAVSVKESFRVSAASRRLPDLLASVRDLRQRMADLENRLAAIGGPANEANKDQEN